MAYLFIPPVVDGNHYSNVEDHPGNKLFKHYSPIPEGVSVWKNQDGTWEQGTYPHQGRQEFIYHDWDTSTYTTGPPGIEDAVYFFLGGHEYVVEDSVALELIAEGYTPTPIP